MTATTTPHPSGLSHTYLSPEEVVALIPGLTKKGLAEWRYEHKGPRYRKLGRVIVYALDEIEAWLEASAKNGEADEP